MDAKLNAQSVCGDCTTARMCAGGCWGRDWGTMAWDVAICTPTRPHVYDQLLLYEINLVSTLPAGGSAAQNFNDVANIKLTWIS